MPIHGRALLCLALLLSTLTLGSGRAAGQTVVADRAAPSLAQIRAVYDDLLDLFYKPLEPTPLLAAGWSALAQHRPKGAPAVPALPALPAEREAAFATFAAPLQQYLRRLPAGMEPLAVAAVIGDGMTRSLHEQHTGFHSLHGSAAGAGGSVAPPTGPRRGRAARNGEDGPLSSRLLPGGIGYIHLDRFVVSGVRLENGLSLFVDFDRRLDDFDAHGAKGLVLDLRDNPGGSVNSAEELLGRFLPEDAPTVTHFDERGHRALGIVSGEMRRTQAPMVVLVNEDSASSSEAVASTLHEAGRALLVGKQTRGALATSEVLRLPGDAALQIAMAEVVSGRAGARIDAQGVPVDIDVDDTPADGDPGDDRDPQLDAAVAALASAPPPPAFQATPTRLPQPALHSLIGGYAPNPIKLDVEGGPVSLQRVLVVDQSHPNQVVGSGTRDPLGVQRALRERGWLGRQVVYYLVDVKGSRGLQLAFDLYESADGATAALPANDFPDLAEDLPAPASLGDGSIARRGVWMDSGESSFAFRRGAVVITAAYSALPGAARMDVALALARSANQQFDRYPLRPDAITRLLLPVSPPTAQAAAPAAATVAPAAAPAPADKARHGGEGAARPSTEILLLAGGGAVALLLLVGRRRAGGR